jgi:hypothetical protein
MQISAPHPSLLSKRLSGLSHRDAPVGTRRDETPGGQCHYLFSCVAHTDLAVWLPGLVSALVSPGAGTGIPDGGVLAIPDAALCRYVVVHVGSVGIATVRSGELLCEPIVNPLLERRCGYQAT